VTVRVSRRTGLGRSTRAKCAESTCPQVQWKSDRANEKIPREQSSSPSAWSVISGLQLVFSLGGPVSFPRLVCVGFSPVPLFIVTSTIIIIIIRDLRAERFIFAAVEDLNNDDGSNDDRKVYTIPSSRLSCSLYIVVWKRDLLLDLRSPAFWMEK